MLVCLSVCSLSPLRVPCCRDTLTGRMYKACVTEAGVPQPRDPHIRSSRIRLDDTPFFASLQQIDVATPAAAPLAAGPPPTTGLVAVTMATPAVPAAAVTPTPRATKRDRSPSAAGDHRDPKVTRRTTSASAGAASDAGTNAGEGCFSQSSTLCCPSLWLCACACLCRCR